MARFQIRWCRQSLFYLPLIGWVLRWFKVMQHNSCWQFVIQHVHIAHNAPCLPPKVLHNYCLQFLMGITVVQRELTWTQLLCKISLLLRSKQSALWAVWKWWIYGKIRQKVNYMSSEKSVGVDAVGTDYVQQHQQNLCNQWTKFQVAFYCLVPFFLLWWQYEPKGLPGRKEVKPGPDWRSNHKHKH